MIPKKNDSLFSPSRQSNISSSDFPSTIVSSRISVQEARRPRAQCKVHTPAPPRCSHHYTHDICTAPHLASDATWDTDLCWVIHRFSVSVEILGRFQCIWSLYWRLLTFLVITSRMSRLLNVWIELLALVVLCCANFFDFNLVCQRKTLEDIYILFYIGFIPWVRLHSFLTCILFCFRNFYVVFDFTTKV